MKKSLVIVESPAKAKTINKFLGSKYSVTSCMGHIRDLPKSSFGVDVENGFKPHYVTISSRRKLLTQLKKDASDKDKIYLATDPDREGEAICWHLASVIGKDKEVFRVEFSEITKTAVQGAFEHPRPIDMNMVNAQQARRILDRIVGYSISPLLWKKVGKGLSAGRVQSVAVRLVVDREKQIKAFTPAEYWEIEAELKKESTFTAKLDSVEGKKTEIKTEAEAKKIVTELKPAEFTVVSVKETKKKRKPQAPFTTSKMQQEGFNKLGFAASKTMRIAQQLYEGIEIGKEGSVGLITYMRTDSVRVSQESQKGARGFILEKFGKEFLPTAPPKYFSKKSAQDAHEAIRPTSAHRRPDDIKDSLTPEQYKLYDLVWRRFIASQMNPALFLATSVDISALESKYIFRATGLNCIFEGFLAVYEGQSEKSDKFLPKLTKDEKLDLEKLTPSQHFTKPPPRYSDATLVKALEEKGIGRPSTYAPIIETVVARDYIRRQGGYLQPSDLGVVVTELLVKHFPKILNIKFTAEMEEDLDEVEQGGQEWAKVLEMFYGKFQKTMDKAKQNMKSLKREVIYTEDVCELCGRPMVIKWGRRGKFLSCSGFPECRHAKSITTGIKCPQDGCDGELVERKSPGRAFFYGCTKYPECKHIARKLPEEKTNNG